MPTTNDERVPAGSIIQRLVREHRRWRSKDFPLIAHLFDEAQSAEGQPPCLAPLRTAFHRLCAEMEGHMTREEHILFPAILEAQTEAPETEKGFGSIRNPIGMIEQEHDWETERLEKMREIARGYRLPEEADEKLRLLFRELEALEAAMHAHSRLESSVLFARALAAENTATAARKTEPGPGLGTPLGGSIGESRERPCAASPKQAA
jgi:regulator of cell morphogenesis and NO signaling